MAKLRSEGRARVLRERARELAEQTFGAMAHQAPAVLHDWERDPSKLPKKPPRKPPASERGAEP